ncbi:uncharacterized [Tachysurus ichikawai]
MIYKELCSIRLQHCKTEGLRIFEESLNQSRLRWNSVPESHLDCRILVKRREEAPGVWNTARGCSGDLRGYCKSLAAQDVTWTRLTLGVGKGMKVGFCLKIRLNLSQKPPCSRESPTGTEGQLRCPDWQTPGISQERPAETSSPEEPRDLSFKSAAERTCQIPPSVYDQLDKLRAAGGRSSPLSERLSYAALLNPSHSSSLSPLVPAVGGRI